MKESAVFVATSAALPPTCRSSAVNSAVGAPGVIDVEFLFFTHTEGKCTFAFAGQPETAADYLRTEC